MVLFVVGVDYFVMVEEFYGLVCIGGVVYVL